DADALRPAFLGHPNEVAGGPLKPRRHHDAVVVPDGRKALPVARITPDRPVLDQITDLQTLNAFVVHDDASVARQWMVVPSQLQMGFAWRGDRLVAQHNLPAQRCPRTNFATVPAPSRLGPEGVTGCAARQTR